MESTPNEQNAPISGFPNPHTTFCRCQHFILTACNTLKLMLWWCITVHLQFCRGHTIRSVRQLNDSIMNQGINLLTDGQTNQPASGLVTEWLTTPPDDYLKPTFFHQLMSCFCLRKNFYQPESNVKNFMSFLVMFDHLEVLFCHFLNFLQPVLVSEGSPLSLPSPNFSLISGSQNRVTLVK